MALLDRERGWQVHHSEVDLRCGPTLARGSFTFLGEAIAGKTPEVIAQEGISLVPEGRDIFSGLTVEENLRLGCVRPQRDR